VPFQKLAETVHPLTHDFDVGVQHGPGARVTLVAIFRRHGDFRDLIGELSRPDGQVIVLRPAFGDQLWRPHDPADAHAWNSPGFRETAGDNDAIAHAPEAFGARL